MPPLNAPAELLWDLAAVLRARGVRWYVFGAQAVVAYGLPRMTADVDVDGFVARTRVLPFVHEATQLPLDLVLAGSGLEEEFLSRARLLDLGGAVVPVLSPARRRRPD